MNEPLPRKLSHGALFAGFFQAGILGFGGVLPVARRMIVDEKRWLTQAQFNDLFALCQSLPGANIVNFAFAFGARNQGVTGAGAAVLGLLMAPVVIVMGLTGLYGRFGGLVPVRHALAGLAAAAAGLMLGAGVKISGPILSIPRNIFVAGAVFALVFLCRLPLLLTMALVLPVSLILGWWAEP
jgi:chromate transporter